jgi:WD40 repeat protein
MLWQVALGRAAGVIALPGPFDGRSPFAFAARTNLLAVAGRQEVLLWETGLRREIRRFPTKPFKSLALSPDGLTLAVGDVNGRAHLHDTRSGELLGVSLDGHLSSVDTLAFSGDGRTLLTGGDLRIKLWNLASQREVASARHAGPVIFATFSANDELLVTADAGLTARVWSAPRLPEPPMAR